jgi:hypothetical protein
MSCAAPDDKPTSRTVTEARLVETASTINGRLKSAWTETYELETAVGFGRDSGRTVTAALKTDVVKIAFRSTSRTLPRRSN